MHYIEISLCGLFLVYISMVAVANGITKRMFSSGGHIVCLCEGVRRSV